MSECQGSVGLQMIAETITYRDINNKGQYHVFISDQPIQALFLILHEQAGNIQSDLAKISKFQLQYNENEILRLYYRCNVLSKGYGTNENCASFRVALRQIMKSSDYRDLEV